MFKDDLTINAQNIYGGIKSHEDGELHTLKALESKQQEIKYFLQHPKRLSEYL